MNRHFWQSPRLWFWLFLVGVALLGAAGCATTSDNQNSSERPWNAPQDWENGMPPGMYQQRPY